MEYSRESAGELFIRERLRCYEIDGSRETVVNCPQERAHFVEERDRAHPLIASAEVAPESTSKEKKLFFERATPRTEDDATAQVSNVHSAILE